jgi:hypothetical protein
MVEGHDDAAENAWHRGRQLHAASGSLVYHASGTVSKRD